MEWSTGGHNVLEKDITVINSNSHIKVGVDVCPVVSENSP